MRIVTVGWNAVLVECDSVREVDAWRAHLWRERDAGRLAATEIVPGAGTVLVDGVPDPDQLAAALAHRTPPAVRPVAVAPPRRVVIPVRYDGQDLDTVAGHWRMPPEAVMATHLATEFQVAFCGFAPGFGYLTGLPEELSVPRLDTPRPRVPAGSVALADRYTGIYPSESPGGWLLIGHTDVRLFDVTADPPALLVPGTAVRFVPAGAGR